MKQDRAFTERETSVFRTFNLITRERLGRQSMASVVNMLQYRWLIHQTAATGTASRRPGGGVCRSTCACMKLNGSDKSDTSGESIRLL